MSFSTDEQYGEHLNQLTGAFKNINTDKKIGEGEMFKPYHTLDDYVSNMNKMKLNNVDLESMDNYNNNFGKHNTCNHRNSIKRQFDGSYTAQCPCSK